MHPTGAPKPHRNIARRGATHGFGSTLEYATRRVIGVVRPGAPKGDDEGPGPGTDRTDVKKEPLLRRFAPGRAVSDVQQGADHSSVEKSHHKESEENEEGAPGRVSLLRHAPSSHLREVENGLDAQGVDRPHHNGTKALECRARSSIERISEAIKVERVVG